MEKKKERNLIILLGIIIVLIACFIIFSVYSIKKKNNEQSLNKNITGKWITNSSQFFVDGSIVSSFTEVENSYISLKDGEIDICYEKDSNYECVKSKYSIANNTINIDENETFLSGKNEIVLENGFLILKRKLDGDKKYVQMILERE